MRLISLRQYSIMTIQTIRRTSIFKLTDILKEEKNNPMLYAPILCYYFSVGRIPKPSTNQKVYNDLKNIKSAGIKTQKDFFEYISKGNNILLIQFVESYIAFNRDRDQNDVKNKCRYFIIKAHEEKGISYYKMCKETGIKPGNLYQFYAKGDNRTVSWAKCLKLLNFLSKEE